MSQFRKLPCLCHPLRLGTYPVSYFPLKMACVPRYASQIGCAQTPDSSLSARSLRLSCMSFLQTDSRGSNSLPRQGGMYGNYTGLECPGPSDRLLYVLTAGSKPAWSPVAVTVNQSSVASLIVSFENQDHRGPVPPLTPVT